MPIIIIMVISVLSYLIADNAVIDDDKIVKRVLVSFLIVLSIFVTTSINNRPIAYTDTLCFSKNVRDIVPNSEDDYLEYGEYRIMKSLESLFVQSWLPDIKKIDSTEYIGLNLKIKGKVINNSQLRNIFKNNKLLNSLDYYRLVLPPDMQISRNVEKKNAEKTTVISLSNIWAVVTIKVSYLEPRQMIFVKMHYEENGSIVYFSEKRKNYERWYSYLRDQLNNIHNWDEKEEMFLNALGNKT